MVAPIPKKYFSIIKKLLEKLPKKNTVSESTCGFKKVNPSVLNITFFFSIQLEFFSQTQYQNFYLAFLL